MPGNKPAQTPVTVALGPVVLNWFDITREQAERSMQSLNARGFQAKEPKFRVNILIDPKTQGNLIALLQKGVADWCAANPAYNNPVLQRDLTPGADPDYPNHIALDIKSKFAPHLFGREGAAEASQFYRGSIVAVGVLIRHYEAGREQGLTLSAESLQFLADGMPLGGGGVSPQKAQANLAGVQTELPPGYSMPTAGIPPVQQYAPQQAYQAPQQQYQAPPAQVYNQPQYAPQTGGL
jgi:hypothetical protein